jgi:hypothetical protein
MGKMDQEERFTCPKRGALVSKDDKFCSNCGASLSNVSFSSVFPEISGGERESEEAYERKFTLTQRFYKLLTSPSEAMRDIAFAPDYEGFFLIFVMEIVLVSVTLWLVFQKIHFVGEHAGAIIGSVTGVIFFAVVLGMGIVIVKWLIKSLIVRHACDNGSGWSFKTAASITGYAYFADIVVGIIGICLSWFLIPSFTVDTTDLQVAIQEMNNYMAQLTSLQLLYSLPVSFIGLLWKSYLGGLGASFGTKDKCSLRGGIIIFFVLGLIGLLFSFVT